MRARDWKTQDRLHLRPARHADHVHARRAHLRAGRRQTLRAGAQRAGGDRGRLAGAAGGRRRGADPRQRLRPEQGARAGRAAASFGITHRVFDPQDVDDLDRAITERTRLVWLEAPGSVTMEFPDLVAQVRLCSARGVLCALDNTWGAGIAFNPFDLLPGAEPLAVDLSIHALTKYPSGGGDVLMGSVVTVDPALHERVLLTHMRLGHRRERQRLRNRAACAAEHLAALPRARRGGTRAGALVRCSSPRSRRCCTRRSSGSPGHAHWQALCGASDAAAGLFSVVLDARHSAAQVDAFCDALRLFKLGYSWGGPMSLVVPYELASMRKTLARAARARHRDPVFHRSGRRRRPARGPGAGAVRAAQRLTSKLLKCRQHEEQRLGYTQLRIREAPERACQEAQERRKAEEQGGAQAGPGRRQRAARRSGRRRRRRTRANAAAPGTGPAST